ncbi:hypothetical protein BpHYR1_031842 [Brachionus plicatilis]|uniref:Uncharacterized protein n=1 Tax=Brachionus plicatilis TaxID=10195 RepID=A0A3M7Q5J8_BRAPC|nr:hypothetical protein BpHYR1_031842 [Brachionus plicatilis]
MAGKAKGKKENENPTKKKAQEFVEIISIIYDIPNPNQPFHHLHLDKDEQPKMKLIKFILGTKFIKETIHDTKSSGLENALKNG